jgi:integrase
MLNGAAKYNKPLSNNWGGLCMKGEIYSDQKCPECGGRFVHFPKKEALMCPIHTDYKATRFKVIYFSEKKWITKRFKEYAQAVRFLTGLRFIHDNMGRVDPKDFAKDQPYGFTVQAKEWLKRKANGEVSPKYFKILTGYVERYISAFGNRSVKEIKFADLEDFMLGIKAKERGKEEKYIKASSKTRHEIMMVLKSIFAWMHRRKAITEMPDFPETSNYVMARRKTIGKDQQVMILEEVKRLTYSMDPKIWLGCKWLSTYYNTRPGEMVKIKWGNIDTHNNLILLSETKEGEPKFIFLLEEDSEIIRSMTRGLPDWYFFRHVKRSGVSAEGHYSTHLFYDWWKAACKNLGVECDLYGGTRHSTVQELSKILSPEKIKKGSGHSTSAAFERYFKLNADQMRDIYSQAAPAEIDKEMTKDFEGSKKAKILNLKE